jgi:hypothetical protein
MNITPCLMMISEQLATAVYILAAFLLFTIGGCILRPRGLMSNEKLTPVAAVVYILAMALGVVLARLIGSHLPYFNGGFWTFVGMWLGIFAAKWVFMKFKIPGIGGAETHDKEQGTTPKPLSHAQTQRAVTGTTPSVDTMKVLATLWHYQHQTFGNDTTKRWTFVLHPVSSDYPGFLAGLSEAVNRGWVAVSPETHHCMLTNEGLAYIEGNVDVQKYGDIYQF